jgi:hypothetical protein
MHHLPSPFLSLSTSFRRSRSRKSSSETTSSTSSTSTSTSSPPSSPASNHNSPQPGSQHHFFNLPFSPSKTHTLHDRQPDHTHSPGTPDRIRPNSDITAHDHDAASAPCAVLRGRSMVLRRRLSKIDMALSEERSRCDGDSIERQGLGLMEPRPVDPVGEVRPNFVMGGIFEVMEGRA